MDWQGEAKRLIAAVHASLPENASLAERKKACRAAGGYHYHGGTSWGKKVWAKHTRAYLEMHGLPPRRPPPEAPQFADDIFFPYRAEQKRPVQADGNQGAQRNEK